MRELILRHKLFFGTIIILILLVIPLTVLQVQQQQDLRQRAAGEKTSLYFAKEASCSDHLTNISLTSGQSAPIYLCLEASNNYTNGISGFNVIFSADNNLTFQSIEPGNNANAFNTPIFQEISNQNKTVHFAKISTENNVTTTPLSLLKLNVIGTGTGSISITTAEITSLTQDPYISAAMTSLPYDVTALTPIVCSSLSSNGRPDVCSNNSGACPADYSRYGFTEATGVAGSIYGTNCTSSATPSRVCCYYAPPTVDTGAPTATPGPTSTPTPIPTPAPGDTVIQFQGLSLNSIFTDKDGKLISNKPQKLTVYLYKSTSDLKRNPDYKNEVQLSFNNGVFPVPSINFGKIDAGTYKILIKSSKYLRKLVATQAVSANGGAITIPSSITLADGAGDINQDNVLNIQDYEAIRSCFGEKKSTSSCQHKDTVDLNDDDKVDGLDYNLFLKSLSLTEREGD